ncbi:MAG: FKBP-type peptidyl-prolyl cis-trans isomerase [Lentimicrobiaceae bacterium]|nr:FKBP-type peptidyl-prolyl cis-trans isomerase [Lentimicrobiaceae bacterium]
MKKLTKLMIALVALVALGTACSKYPGFKKDKEEGFYYKFYVENKHEVKPQIGDIVDVTYNFRIKDSILVKDAPLYDQIIESLYAGDVYAALRKMHLGDSATFILDGIAFFQHFMGQPWPFETDELYFDVILHQITPQEEYEEIQAQQLREYEAMIEELRLAEGGLIRDYIERNNIRVQPTANGLYLVRTVNGGGKAIKAGSRVMVHYTGKLLDGTIFDSSVERGEPFEVTVGEGFVIPGWEEALLLMRGGDKATVLIPSRLAYGSRGAGYVIMPYTPIVFEIEIISVE